METTPREPQVALGHDDPRPLNWRVWQGLPAAEQARLRCALMQELRDCDRDGWAPWVWRYPHRPWDWRHTHREVLDLKAASGRA